jgi:hypothetical protein
MITVTPLSEWMVLTAEAGLPLRRTTGSRLGGKSHSMWESTQLMSSEGIIGTIAAVMTKPNRQNKNTTVMEVEGAGR